MPRPGVTITKSHSGTVYAGTELVLTADVIFNNLKGVDVNISIVIKWDRCRRNGAFNTLVNNTRTTVSALSGSHLKFKASLTYSRIATSDSGCHWATVSVKSSDNSIYIMSSTNADKVNLTVNGE